MKKKQLLELGIHILFWIGVISLLNSDYMDLGWGPFSKHENTLTIPLLYGFTINLILFYCNALWLIPQKLKKKQYRTYWIQSLLILIGLTILEIGIDFLYLGSIGKLDEDQINVPSIHSRESALFDLVFFISSTFFFNAFFWAMAFLYRFPKDFIQNERQKRHLIQDKLTAELDFLKAQINPHFLFNGINSIYHLIGSDDEGARSTLLKFSDLLRYQLYECNDEYINLNKEITYLRNYIGIEKVRKETDATIQVVFPDQQTLDQINGLKIAPLLLSPFLENAFKYLSLYSEKERNQVFIKIDLVNNILQFNVKNTYDPSIKLYTPKSHSGIGLENAKRRLNLLYPERHHLRIDDDIDGLFEVSLKINLS